MSEPRQTTLGFEDEEFKVKRVVPKYKVGDEVTVKPEFAYLRGQEDEIWIIVDVLFEFGDVMYFADKKGHEKRISTALFEDQIQTIQEPYKFDIGAKVRCKSGFEGFTFTITSRGRASGSGAKSYFLASGNVVTNVAEDYIELAK